MSGVGGYLKANLAGITEIPALNTQSLTIKGKPFEDYITELVIEDQFEQAEITELKQLVQFLDTTGLNTAWLVDNTNKNAELKTAVDNLNDSVGTINTNITNLSNAVTTISDKTRYVSSVQGNNTAPKVASDFQVSIGDRDKRRIYMTTGANSISSINDSTNQSTAGNYADNNITLVTQTGMISNIAHLNRIQSIDTIEITGFGGMGIQSSPNIKIGNKGAQILIGSEDTPEIGSTNTIIKIGKRDITKNTETQFRGNFLLAEARFNDLTMSQALTWSNFLALISTSGMPAWVASAILTSAIPNFVYSDLWAMKGTITKDGDVETITTPKVKSLTIYDSSVGVNILPKVTTFLAQGDISETTLVGNIRAQTFNGEILLRNNNILATNVNWAITDAMDKVNALKLSNNDVELIAGAGASNSQMRISNTCTGGKIRIRMGTDGLQSNSHDALSIYNDTSAGTSQVLIAGSNVPSGYDTSSKLLVDHQSLTNGIKVTKASETLVTRINHNNINTPSLTLQTNWTGTTTNSLYINQNGQLMFNGSAVGSGTGGDSGGGGIIYLLQGPTSDITYTDANLTTLTYAMTATYSVRANTRIRLGNYNAGTDYNLFNHRGPIPRSSSNPILKGSYEYNPYITYNGNVSAQFFVNVFFYADTLATLSPFDDALITKNYPLALQGTTGFRTVGLSSQTTFIPTNSSAFTLNIRQISFPFVTYNGSNVVLRCEIVDTDNNIVFYTFPNITLTSAGGGTQNSQITLTFDAGSVVTVTQGFIWIGTRFRFRVTLVSGSSGCFFAQSTAFNSDNMSFRIPHFTGVNFSTQLSINSANRATIPALNSNQTLHSLTMPITDYDISIFSNPQLDLLFYFNQPSGNTNNHTIDVNFWDGALSHVHTSINPAPQAIPSLSQVMNVGNSAPASLNMNNNIITNIAYPNGLIGTDSIAWNVRNIVAGTGISSSNAGDGTITISAPSLTEPSMYFGIPTIGNFGGFSNNGFSISTLNWDFEKFEYDITIDIQVKSGSLSGNSHIAWYWDNDTTTSKYYQNWLDHDGGSFLASGGNNSNVLFFMYTTGNLHHNFKATLRQPMVNASWNSYQKRLMLEHSCCQTFAAGTSWLGNFRTSRGYDQYQPTTTLNSTLYPFNGTRTITFYNTAINNFFTSPATLEMVRIYRRPIKF